MNILLNKPVAPCLKTLNLYLEQINKRGWYTNFGPLHDRLTAELQEYLQVENLLLVSNGTLGLQVAYKALNLRGAICTPFSYAATAGSLAWDKIPLAFADINPNSLTLCPSRTTEKLNCSDGADAVVATHVYGNPCDIESFDSLRANRGTKVIYDAAHAFGVEYNKRSILSYGDASVLSFHATKVFHTIEGGAIVFQNREAYEKARQLINFSLDSAGEPTGAGTNAKLNEYQCAVGLTLLANINTILDHRRALFARYESLLESCIELPKWNTNTSLNNGSYFPVILENESARRDLQILLTDMNIQSRAYFSPSLNTVFNPRDSCPESESIASRILCLPMHFYLTFDEVQYIVRVIRGRKK